MTLPAPLVPLDVDVDGLSSFMLDTDRLLNSELLALSTGDEFKAALTLWMRAWKQRPSGSLPDDDAVLATFSGAGRRWAKVRKMALRGFIRCSDGRLYHRVLCEDVLRAAHAKRQRRERTAAATEARKRQRDAQRHDERDVNVVAATVPTVTFTHRQDRTGQDEERKKEEATPPLESLEAVGSRACEAAGLDVGRVAVDFVEVKRWLAAGYSVELDILPTIRGMAMAADYELPTTLRYFSRAIARAQRRRLEPLPHVNGPRKSVNVMVGSREDIEQQLDMGLMTPDEARAELAKLGEKVRD